MPSIKVNPKHYAPAELTPAAEILRRGGLVIFPTETVYGIAANAALPEALARLVALKQSPPDRPFTYHIADVDDIYRYVNQVPALAHRLIRNFWPGPLTVLLESPDERKWVGIRLPDHLVARDLIRLANVPIVAPSANLTSQLPPRDAAGISPALANGVDLVIDSGPARLGTASTIVKVYPDNRWEIIRQGAIPETDIRRLAVKTILFVCTGNTCRSPMAVGLLEKMLAMKLGAAPTELEGKGYKVISGGTAAVYGMPASEHALAAVAELGGDISGHRSQPVTPTMIEEADKVYVMTRGHLTTLTEWLPSAASKITLLDPQGEDVSDPIGGGAEVYRQCALKIKSALEIIIKNL